MGLIDMNKLKSESEKDIVPFHIPILLEEKEISDRLRSVGDLSKEEIYSFLLKEKDSIFSDKFLGIWEYRENLIYAFHFHKFLEVIESIIQYFSCVNIICFNKVCYDIITKPEYEELKKTMVEIIYEISTILNMGTIQKLVPIVGEATARKIAFIHNSSFNQEKNIQRVNKIIAKELNSNSIEMQTVIDIYSILYHDCFSLLFNSTMMDQSEIISMPVGYAKLHGALFTILDNMPSNMIYTVLKNYSSDVSYRKLKVRFPIYKTKDNFQRIWNIVDSLREEEGIYVP